MILFNKKYDGESIVDMTRDLSEALSEDYNPLVKDVPVDKYGIQSGTFMVTLEWIPE